MRKQNIEYSCPAKFTETLSQTPEKYPKAAQILGKNEIPLRLNQGKDGYRYARPILRHGDFIDASHSLDHEIQNFRSIRENCRKAAILIFR
jgi:hypothetical protein